VLAFGLAASGARADDVADPAPRTPAATPAPSGGGHHSRRLVYAGLLAALFLIVGAAAGKNDKPGPKTT
jgi:hypothetical protein